NRKDGVIRDALRKIYRSCEVEKEFGSLKLSLKNETTGQNKKDYSRRNIFSRIWTTWSNPLERGQIVVGIGLQCARLI
ncbi:hypothetical protein MKW92_027070, partial [Papaver armeniacum]